ncbi:MAG: rhodanese-like domain-containing protein [Bacteroidales bacterium]|nr:rhodanese-like domain-containing protein [Bacteroidales bacterium]
MNKGFFSHGVFNFTPGESYKLCSEGAVIVDVREEYMTNFKMFNVDNLIYLPFSRLKDFYRELPSDRMLIFADSSGLKSRECVIFMTEQGYKNVANMAGGMIEWERDGLPVKIDKNFRLSGSCMCQIKAREKGK